ncbi:SH3 domain-containing protein [Paenibacillus sp. WLX2291]|uniref:SH3 domain-containing protein n=1 Tax=Paenibacillus sp. WLX2291 TaxID=3296934 RepID=UPI0039843BA6
MNTYIVVKSHCSNYPNPITFQKGEGLVVGERYDGPEEWPDWYFCTNSDGISGWVPGQVFVRSEQQPAQGISLEDYTALEMNVLPGEIVISQRERNGWVWCMRQSDGAEGWLPLDHLQLVEDAL